MSLDESQATLSLQEMAARALDREPLAPVPRHHHPVMLPTRCRMTKHD